MGALTGGTRGKTLLASVRGELAKIRNGLGKPAGRYKEAVEELDRAKQSVTTLEARQRSLVQDIGALQTAKRKLAEADIAGEEARTDDLLVEARQKRDVAQRFEDQESNATSPAIRYMPAIIQFLGHDPLPPTNSFSERLATARRVFGLSQLKMAEKMGVDPTTLRGWEAERHQPTKKSLDVIVRVLQTR